MKSISYHNSNIKNSHAQGFINSSIEYLYQEIQLFLGATRRRFDEYHLIQFGELTMVNFFTNGLVRNNSEFPCVILNELWTPKKKEQTHGRADIIVEDILTHEVYYIEAKKHDSSSDAPTKQPWLNKKLIEEYYDQILSQAKGYIENDWRNYLRKDLKEFGAYERNTFFAVALVFDSVVFNNDSEIESWHQYKPSINNEFYSFKTFEHHNSKNLYVGLACYGKAIEVNPRSL